MDTQNNYSENIAVIFAGIIGIYQSIEVDVIALKLIYGGFSGLGGWVFIKIAKYFWYKIKRRLRK